MLDKRDILSTVANILPDEDKAKLVAGLAIQQMIANLRTRTQGVSLMDNPFTAEPFTVRTTIIERDGQPALTSALFQGLPSDVAPTLICVLTRTAEDEVAPMLALAEPLTAFGKLVLAALDSMFNQAEETQPSAA